MNLTRLISFRAGALIADTATAISMDHDISQPDLLRFALSYGIKNAGEVAAEKRSDLSLSEALYLQALGIDYK